MQHSTSVQISMGDDNAKHLEFVCDLPDLVLDSKFRLCCLVCRTYLPGNEKSAKMHIQGRKHSKTRSKLSPNEIQRRLEKVLSSENKNSRTDAVATRYLNRESSEIPPDMKEVVDEVLPFVYEPKVSTNDKLFQHVDYVNHVLETGRSDVDANGNDFCERATGFVPLLHPLNDERCFFATMPNEIVPLNHFDKLGISKPEGLPRNNKNSSEKCNTKIPSRLEETSCRKSRNHFPPWLLRHDAQCAVRNAEFDDEMNVLHLEIIEFTRFITPSVNEEKARKSVIEIVKLIADALWTESTLSLFGSYAAGVSLPNSDIDISIEAKLDCDEASACKKLARVVRQLPGFATRLRVVKARVPIVKIECHGGSTRSTVKCDICFNRNSSVKFVQQIKNYICMYPALRPLLIVIKCLISQSGIDKVEMGGLPSYGVLLLVYCHLQLFRVNFPKREINLGTILVSFFELYGRLHNFNKVGIAPGLGLYYDKLERFDTQPEHISHFSIQDPNDETNEIGLYGHGADKIRDVFMLAEKRLKNWLADGAASPLSTILDQTRFHFRDDDM